MVKLSEFIGEMVSDISDARRIADSNSIALSQSYHADPFLKGMPVPHYTIQEAEIKVPVSVNKVTTSSQNKELMQSFIPDTIKLKLPQLLINSFTASYIEKKKREKEKEKEEQENNVENMATYNNVFSKNLRNMQDGSEQAIQQEAVGIEDDVCIKYNECASKITEKSANFMYVFINTSNSEVLRLLDIKDKFIESLTDFTAEELSKLPPGRQPFAADDLKGFANEIGTAMFFEFKSFFDEDRGVSIEPNTGKLNEYLKPDNMLFLTVKIKEQDLDIVVENKGNNTDRFLSLN